MLKLTQKQLEDIIRYHRYLYYEKSKPIISDYNFDQLCLRLEKEFPKSKVINEIECPRELHAHYEQRYMHHLESGFIKYE
jgi:NAD-dependent DNA ligase